MDDTVAELENLIAAVARGDRVAFRKLYAAVSGKLFGVCLRILKDRARAEDALQDSFLKIWRNAVRYRPGGARPMTWLITIARNTAIDRARSEREEAVGDIENLGLEAVGAGPEASAVAASETRRIVECLDRLSADRRTAVTGAYLEGRSYAELAQDHGVPLNTMRTWLRRSLIALRECLAL